MNWVPILHCCIYVSLLFTILNIKHPYTMGMLFRILWIIISMLFDWAQDRALKSIVVQGISNQ